MDFPPAKQAPMDMIGCNDGATTSNFSGAQELLLISSLAQ